MKTHRGADSGAGRARWDRGGGLYHSGLFFGGADFRCEISLHPRMKELGLFQSSFSPLIREVVGISVWRYVALDTPLMLLNPPF